MEMTKQQSQALKDLEEFLKGRNQVYRLTGYAGTGKSTIVSRLKEELGVTLKYGTPTAKAAHVLKTKGVSDARTLHSMMYKPYEKTDKETGETELRFSLNERSELWDGGVIVVDEASMVPDWIVDDLLQFPVKVIAIGDPGQLPPVKSAGNRSLLSGDADTVLTEVHRTALDSPVTALATKIRIDGQLPSIDGGRGGSRIVSKLSDVKGFDPHNSQIIVGRHVTRDAINSLVKNGSTRPEKGDRVLCKRNNSREALVNGEQMHVEECKLWGDKFHMKFDTGQRLSVWPQGFQPGGVDKLEAMSYRERKRAMEFWFGYAVTCHSAQGSQWEHVLVVDEGRVFGKFAARWTYTAVTRASETVTVARSL